MHQLLLRSLRVISVVGILLVTLFIRIPRVWGSSEILINGSFEDGILPWKSNASSVIVTLSQLSPPEGAQYIRIENTKSSSSGIEQTISSIQGGLTYRIQGLMRVVPNTEKAFVRVAWYESLDGSGAQMSTVDTEVLPVSFEFMQATLLATAPAAARSAKLRILVSQGAADADAFSWMPVPPSLTPTITPSPTPSSSPTPTRVATLQPTPADTPQPISGIYISEFHPYPLSGEQEWVELYNDLDVGVSLIDWYIDDTEGTGSSPKKFSLTIPPKGYGAIDLPSAMLNNGGDTVRLLDGAGRLVDTVSYESNQRGMSWGWRSVHSADYCIQFPSKNLENHACTADQEQEELMEISTPPASPDTDVFPGGNGNVSRLGISPSSPPHPLVSKRYGMYDPQLSMSFTSEPHEQNNNLVTKQNHPNEPAPLNPPVVPPLLPSAYSLLAVASIVMKMRGW